MARASHPPGYPDGYDLRLRLDDGRRVQVRPILPSDADELAEAIRTADPETLRARFLGATPRITPALLDSLTRLDYTSRFALVARAHRHGVAIARYVSSPAEPGTRVTAEVAAAVDPEWRRVGLATRLLRLLARRATECDIGTFTVLFSATNRPVAELARDVHARLFIADGLARFEIPLDTLPADL
ncbi:MAG TPA: GNAT family N-acetyltransferase [Jatrophihabitans sp.]|nr:GNAT family N-acetyltransferase [Jatrophihabitans sp.]